MGKILILEDEQSVNRGISFSLDKAGHQTCSCYTVGEAKMQIVSFQPDLVICDINLPDGNGLDFMIWLRQQVNAYTICLTALGQEMDQVLGYESGADDYVTKPFSLSILLLKIEAFFKRRAKDAGTGILYSGSLSIDLSKMRLLAGDVEISLSKNEWRLLSLFLNHSRQVLSKRQILENVFDLEGEFVDENTLAVNIRRLREKIEENPAKPVYIKNIRGMGYVWDMDVK